MGGYTFELPPFGGKKSQVMKIEIIKEVAGMKVGTVKNVPSTTAKNLISRGLAKAVEVPDLDKMKKTELIEFAQLNNIEVDATAKVADIREQIKNNA